MRWDGLPIFGKDPKKDADALLYKLADLREDILSYELRYSFLADLRKRSERLSTELQDRPDGDPHKSIVSMLCTASQGMNEDEFTTPKLEALQQCLIALGASRMAPDEVERCRSAMLWAGLLGYGYSGGKRATVDGKY
jgi:hypothetical protein